MNSIIKKFSSPFPFSYFSLSLVKRFLLIGLFISGFLYFFKPFGLHNAGSNTIWMCVMYGLITFVSCTAIQSLTEFILTTDHMQTNWKLWQWLLQTLALVMLIAVCNYILTVIILDGSFTWKGLKWMSISTFSVAFFPITFLGLLLLNHGETKYASIASEIKVSKQIDKETKFLEGIPTDTILYIESMQNYAKIVHLDADSKPTHSIVRETMKSLEEQSKDTSLIRCHRTYLVNRDMIKSVNGNAQGLKLGINYTEDIVNVSRSYVDVFRKDTV